MKKSYLFVAVFALTTLFGCHQNSKNMQEKETEVLIETSQGDLRVKLYNETPQHRDNFLKLVREGVYDNILFHRIVRNFMVQTGDPVRRPADAPASKVDTNTLKYTIPAEIRYPRYFHKNGALAAARQPDSINPTKASSSCHFYIVSGKPYTSSELMELNQLKAQQRIEQLEEELSKEHIKELYLLRKRGEKEKYQALKDSILRRAQEAVMADPPLPFTAAQKKAYAEEGGAPYLDGEYTVFGEVIEGFPVIDALSRIKTNGKEQPLTEVVVKKISVIE